MTIQKLQVMSDMAQNNEVKALCNILIEHFNDTETTQIGFTQKDINEETKKST